VEVRGEVRKMGKDFALLVLGFFGGSIHLAFAVYILVKVISYVFKR
jgi:hypothetical protein